MPDYYEILGVAPDATDEEIRAAYRARARQLHPDAHPESRRAWANRRFAELSEAYECLSDATARQRYDERRSRGAAAGPDLLTEVPSSAACFYHTGHAAVAMCPSCGRAVCAVCVTGTGPCRACTLRRETLPVQDLPPGTQYEAFAARVEEAREAERRMRECPPVPLPLMILGCVWYPLASGLSASTWALFAFYERFERQPGLRPLLIVVGALAAAVVVALLHRGSRKAARVIGLAAQPVFVGAVLAFVLMPWAGDLEARRALSNEGVPDVELAVACYRRGAMATAGATLLDASRLLCAAARAELSEADASLKGERRTTLSVLRGYWEEFRSVLDGTEAPRADVAGASAALARADRLIAEARIFDAEGAAYPCAHLADRIRTRIASEETQQRTAAPGRE